MAPPTILVVEDNAITRKMLRVTLESEGYAVIEAGDARTALAEAAARAPDLVLQDLILPDMNGFELVRQLRALPGIRDIPIVALSGFLGRLEDAHAERAAFTALLLKPIAPTDLVAAIETFLPGRPHVAVPSHQGRRVMVVDDDPVQLKLARLSLIHLGFTVEAVESGWEALRAARDSLPDVMVSDVLMRGMDGFQLCLAVRTDPQLASLPVVLLSAWYQTQADADLARRVGASALVTRTPDLDQLPAAIASAIARGAPRPDDAPNEQVRLEHAKAVIKQLERQLILTGVLARRCTLQSAQIALLSGVADALTHKADADVAQRDVLAATLDAAGISKGALFLRDPTGAMALRHSIGFSAGEQEHLPSFFGELAVLEDIVARQAAVSIPSDDVPAAVAATILAGADVAVLQIVSLVTDGRGAGAIILGVRSDHATSEDAVDFTRAMGNQLTQSLALASTFGRLAASEQRYRTLMENANDCISILTPDGVIREVNRRHIEIFGYSAEEMIGRHINDFAVPGRAAGNSRTYAEIVATGPSRSPPVALRKRDGGVVMMEFSNAVLELGGEQLVLTVGRDVTDQLQAQTQLMVTDRMASMGTLAAGVAHEINNPLAATIANLDLALTDTVALGDKLGAAADLGELVSELREAREAAERVREIVRDIKMFSRAEDERRGPIDCHRVIDSSLRMAGNEIRHRAQLVKEYGKVPLVLANESRLGQVVLNLVVNAAQAIAEGHADENEIRVRTHTDPTRGCAVIEIADTGMGIRPEIMNKLFTPFFTTKQAGVGTGLGLAICHRIVTGMGGEISVTSEVGVGTTFRVTVPMAPDSAPVVLRPAPATPASRRRGRVLVVDDERSICTVIRRMLGAEHDVAESTSAGAALRRVAGGERFDVIFCDLMMPVMTGMDLHAELARTAPEQAERMVFVTGGAFTAGARSFLDEVPNARVEKPFDLETLRALVNARL